MHHGLRHTIIAAICFAAIVCFARYKTVRGQLPPARPISYADLFHRLECQERELYEIRQRLDRQELNFAGSSAENRSSCYPKPEIVRLPVVVETEVEPSCGGPETPESHTLKFYADYDNGFVIRPFDEAKDPFELKVNGRIQFRHHAFARDVDSWTDNAGITRPISNCNLFDIERGRLTFSGNALSPRLSYFLQLDGDMDDGYSVDVLDYLWGWECSERFQFQLGKRKVPASRQWILSSRNTRLVDRPMANNFFRPDRTTGAFGVGRIGETGHYELMIGNGYATSNLTPSELDARFAYAATNYWDPLGDFGRELVDYEDSATPLVRIGHSAVYAPDDASATGQPLDEEDYVRLTDGTQLTATGALAPGVTVSQFDVYFYGVDVAAKWRGWSVDAEVFLRWIDDIRGNGPLPLTDLFQRGFYVEGGRFLIPETLDVNVRYSQVSGLFGDSSEYAAGFNWFPLDTTKLKISSDVTVLDGSPVNNSSSDVLVGDSGVLFRTQLQAEF